jgi:V/A-type H+-transporting ATPase subunit I
VSIVALKKLTFCGLVQHKLAVLTALQEIGGAHLIPTHEEAVPLGSIQLKQYERAYKALKYLNDCPNKRHQQHDHGNFDFGNVIDRVLEIQLESRKNADIRDALLKRIKEVEPWGNFSLPEDSQLAGLKLWFYIVPKQLMKKMQTVDLVWQVVWKDNLHDYVVVIDPQEPSAATMPVARTHTGHIPLAELKENLEQAELALEDLQAEREYLTRWIGLISANLGKAQEQADLKAAHAMTLEKDEVFIVQAWVAESEVEIYKQFAGQHQLALLCAEPSKAETPPTLLNNPQPWAGGQDLVNFYQTPGYFDWDPSPVVFFSFAVFFAMIMSDAGYASLFALMLGAKWRSLGKSAKNLRIRTLALTIIMASLLWGVLCNSYFGYGFPQESLPAKLQLFDMDNFDSMMRLSIFVGAAHIAIANLIKAYQRRYSLRALASLGWVAIVIGGFLAWQAVSPPNAQLNLLAKVLMITGCGCLLFFSGEGKLLKPLDWLWRILEGLRSLTEITNLFGNVLSYLRLFALGMASVSLALTFNRLALQVYHDLPGAGLFASMLILLCGHILNILLCLLSGLVHGLRLNFIEFYNWSVSDEGYPFKAFAKKGAGQ